MISTLLGNMFPWREPSKDPKPQYYFIQVSHITMKYVCIAQMQRILMELVLYSYSIFCQCYDIYTLRQYFSLERTCQRSKMSKQQYYFIYVSHITMTNVCIGQMQRFLMVLVLCSYHIFCQCYDIYTFRQYVSLERTFQNGKATVLLHIGEPYHYHICVYRLDAAFSNVTSFIFRSQYSTML